MNRHFSALTSLLALSLAIAPGCGSDDVDDAATDPVQAGSCTIVDKGDGTSAIQCPDGTELIVENGKPGTDGEKGPAGKDGEKGDKGEDGDDAAAPCRLSDNGDGTHSLSCGGTTVTIGDSCENGFASDLVVTDYGNEGAESLTLFQATSCTWIRGEVLVGDYSETTLPKALERIEKVDLGVFIFDNDNLESFAFPSLREALSLVATGNPALTTVGSFPMLESVGYDLQLENNDSLTDIGHFPELKTARSVFIRENPELLHVGGFPALEKVLTLDISTNPVLLDVGEFSALETVISDLRIRNNAALTEIGDFPALEKVQGLLRIEENVALTSTGGFPALRMLRSLFVVDNPKLASMGAFPKVEDEVLALKFENNGSLTGLPSFDSLVEIGEGLLIEKNGTLTSLDGLRALETVYTVVSIVDNPKLAQCHVDELLDGITMDLFGVRITSGNDESATCP